MPARSNALTRLSFGARTENAQQLLVPARAKTRTRRYQRRWPKSGLASRFSHAVNWTLSGLFRLGAAPLPFRFPLCPLSAVRNPLSVVTGVCPFERTLLLYRNFLRRNTGRPNTGRPHKSGQAPSRGRLLRIPR